MRLTGTALGSEHAEVGSRTRFGLPGRGDRRASKTGSEERRDLREALAANQPEELVQPGAQLIGRYLGGERVVCGAGPLHHAVDRRQSAVSRRVVVAPVGRRDVLHRAFPARRDARVHSDEDRRQERGPDNQVTASDELTTTGRSEAGRVPDDQLRLDRDLPPP